MSYRFLDCKYFKNTFLETFPQRYGINKILWFNDLSFFRQVWKVKLFSNSMLSVCFFGKFYYYQVVIRVDYQPMFWKELALFGSWGDLNRGWLVKIERKIAIYSSVSSSFFFIIILNTHQMIEIWFIGFSHFVVADYQSRFGSLITGRKICFACCWKWKKCQWGGGNRCGRTNRSDSCT